MNGKEPEDTPISWWRYLFFILLCLCLIATGYFFYFSKEIKTRFAARKWSVPARVFSATTPLYPGQPLPLSTLREMLARRSYQQATGTSLHAGEYLIGPDSLTVFLREFRFPGKSLGAQRVLFQFAKNKLVSIEGPQGILPFLELEPVDLAQLFGAERESRQLINLRQAPRCLIDAVLAIEDHRFYEHPGLDWWSIVRALWTDIRAGGIVQGGSTITQQLVKNYFLQPERTVKRKVVEASMALILEASFTKDEILELYLNEIYLGQRGSAAIHGMGEAARHYFGRNVEDLTLSEAAALAGMIRAPNHYSPYRHPAACQERRNAVLRRMLELGRVAPEDYEEARAVPLRVADAILPLQVSPYFVDYVRQQLQQLYSAEVLEREGLNIYTTLHAEIAHHAEQAVTDGVEELERDHPHLLSASNSGPLQAAMIVVQPKTGAVLALVGGRDYDSSNYNRVLYAQRQPGSAIKPFVYLAALDQFNTSSWITDEPTGYRVNGGWWLPRNFDGQYRGSVMVREALEHSLNAATVQLAMTTGLEKVTATMRTLGIQSPMAPVPSLALGAFEMTPLELAGAYSTLDNDGQKPYLLSVKEVVTAAGELQQQRHIDFTSVTSAAKAYIITNMLEGVIQRGTARGVKAMRIDFPSAGKTGTSSGYQDSWFVGYTTDLLAVVWVGFDDNTPTRLTGATGALRIWAQFFNAIRPWLHPQRFRVPPGIVERYVCRESGLLASKSCSVRQLEPFLSDKVPEQTCGMHVK